MTEGSRKQDKGYGVREKWPLSQVKNESESESESKSESESEIE